MARGRREGSLGLVILLLGCGSHSTTTSTPPAASPGPIAALGALATPQESLTLDLSATAADFPLPGGAVLHVPAGALSAPTKVTVARFALGLDQLSFYVAGASAYQVSADRNVDRISPPLRLEVPGADSDVAVDAQGTAWAKRSEFTAGAPAVLIDHFSAHTFAFVQPTPALSPEAALPAPPTAMMKVTAANDYIRDNANEWERAFLGVGDSGAPVLRCSELLSLIASKEKTWDFKYPADVVSDPVFDALRLGMFLFTSKSSSEVTGPEQVFWRKTQDAQVKIRERVLAAGQRLTPADLLQIAVEESGNNAAMGILAAHNFLKELANEGRDMIFANLGNPFTGELGAGPKLRGDPTHAAMYLETARTHGGELAAKLQPWRARDRSAAGSYDKLGPLYHLFAAMTATTFLPHINGGPIAVNGEEMLRATGITGDVPDPEKGDADGCGEDVGDAVVKLFGDPAAVPEPSRDAGVDAAPPASGGIDNLTCGMNTAWDGDRCYFIRETPRLYCLPVSAGSLQYAWQEYRKDNRYWYLTVSYLANLRQYGEADAANGFPTGNCQKPSLGEALACLVADRNAETSDCVDISKLGQRCLALYSLTDICGRARLSQMYFPKGSENYDEIWAFIKAHAETNDSYDTPP